MEPIGWPMDQTGRGYEIPGFLQAHRARATRNQPTTRTAHRRVPGREGDRFSLVGKRVAHAEPFKRDHSILSLRDGTLENHGLRQQHRHILPCRGRVSTGIYNRGTLYGNKSHATDHEVAPSDLPGVRYKSG